MSREIDKLVAERVMGYRLHHDDCNTYWIDSDGEEPTHGHDYSSDIAAAWEVVERIKDMTPENTEFFSLEWTDAWQAGFQESIPYEGCYFKVSATADTAPMAISLAALKARGVEFKITN